MEVVELVPERVTEVYRLLPLCTVLRKLDSFAKPVCATNFAAYAGWGSSKVCVQDRFDTLRPSTMRGDAIIEVHHLRKRDRVQLTDDQWEDFMLFSVV